MISLVRILLSTLGICLITLSSSAADETTPLRYNIFPLNGEIRYERDSSQQLTERRLRNYALGMRQGPVTWLFEYAQFSEKTGNLSLSTERNHQEFLLWWKQNLLTLELAEFFVSGGVGAYQESVVRTLIGGESSRDRGPWQVMGGVSSGLQTQFLRYVLVSIEGRLMAGKNFDPNPQADVLLRLGVEF